MSYLYVSLQSNSLRPEAVDVVVNAPTFARPDEEVSSSTVTTTVSDNQSSQGGSGGIFERQGPFLGVIK